MTNIRRTNMTIIKINNNIPLKDRFLNSSIDLLIVIDSIVSIMTLQYISLYTFSLYLNLLNNKDSQHEYKED